MNISIVCEVISSLYDKIYSDDPTLPEKARNARKRAIQPKLTNMANRTIEASGRKLVCYFGEESEIIEAVQEMVDLYSNPQDFVRLCSHWQDGLKHGERVTDIETGITTVPTPTLAVDHARLFKYANAVGEFVQSRKLKQILFGKYPVLSRGI